VMGAWSGPRGVLSKSGLDKLTTGLAGACDFTAEVGRTESARRINHQRVVIVWVLVCMRQFPSRLRGWPSLPSHGIDRRGWVRSEWEESLPQERQFLLRPIFVLLPAGEASPLEAQPQVFDERDVVDFSFQTSVGRGIR